DKVALVILQLPEPSATAVPNTVLPFVSYKVTVAPTSALLPVKVGVVLFVMLSVLEVPESDPAIKSGAEGAATVVSIVTLNALDATLTFPARSVCLAVKLCEPGDKVALVILQLPEPSATAVPNTVLPFVSYKVTV